MAQNATATTYSFMLMFFDMMALMANFDGSLRGITEGGTGTSESRIPGVFSYARSNADCTEGSLRGD